MKVKQLIIPLFLSLSINGASLRRDTDFIIREMEETGFSSQCTFPYTFNGVIVRQEGYYSDRVIFSNPNNGRQLRYHAGKIFSDNHGNLGKNTSFSAFLKK